MKTRMSDEVNKEVKKRIMYKSRFLFLLVFKKAYKTNNIKIIDNERGVAECRVSPNNKGKKQIPIVEKSAA